MKRFAVIALLLLASCATTTQTDPNAEFLLKLDREFAKQSAARGALAWEEYMAPGAGKPANAGQWLMGPEEIGKNMRTAFESGFTLAWEPMRAELSRGGKLGYTWGRYHSVFKGKARDGAYITVWEKQSNGSWKVLFDTGDPD
jgi:ketosteroid isomerase-like protein